MWIRSTRKAERSDTVSFTVDGRPVSGHAGEMLAVALRGAGIEGFRFSSRDQDPRGPFCLMGVCQECLVWIDGRRCLSCRVEVQRGIEVVTGNTPPGLGTETEADDSGEPAR